MRDLAIRNTHSTVVTINGDTDATDEKGNVVTLKEALITAEISRLQAEYDSKEYQRQRAKAYPSIADQLDTIYHCGIDAWKLTITTVKEEFPK